MGEKSQAVPHYGTPQDHSGIEKRRGTNTAGKHARRIVVSATGGMLSRLPEQHGNLALLLGVFQIWVECRNALPSGQSWRPPLFVHLICGEAVSWGASLWYGTCSLSREKVDTKFPLGGE